MSQLQSLTKTSQPTLYDHLKQAVASMAETEDQHCVYYANSFVMVQRVEEEQLFEGNWKPKGTSRAFHNNIVLSTSANTGPSPMYISVKLCIAATLRMRAHAEGTNNKQKEGYQS